MKERIASGRYRFDASSVKFFGCDSIHLILRGASIIGRFGRTGTIRGAMNGSVARANWFGRGRHGWMTLQFDPDSKSIHCEYGAIGGPAIGKAILLPITRPSSRRNSS